MSISMVLWLIVLKIKCSHRHASISNYLLGTRGNDTKYIITLDAESLLLDFITIFHMLPVGSSMVFRG